jgi:hypothetical protein
MEEEEHSPPPQAPEPEPPQLPFGNMPLPPPPAHEAPPAAHHQPSVAPGEFTINDSVANPSGHIEESIEAREARKRRQRWGAAANAPKEDGAAAAKEGEEQPKKKRKSRWESEEVTTVGAYMPMFPKEITLPGGLRVSGHAAPVLAWIAPRLLVEGGGKACFAFGEKRATGGPWCSRPRQARAPQQLLRRQPRWGVPPLGPPCPPALPGSPPPARRPGRPLACPLAPAA